MIDISALLAPLRNRVVNMVSRAVVNLVDDARKLQELQISGVEGDDLDEVERFQNYGFTSVPLKDAEAIVLRAGGRGDHPIVIAVDDRRYRIRNLENGEVAMYTDQGDSIVIKRGGNVEVTAATKVKVTAPVVELAGNSEPVLLGTSYHSAVSTYFAAILTALQSLGVGPPASVPITGAALAGLFSTFAATVTPAFTASATAAKSTKVKLS